MKEELTQEVRDDIYENWLLTGDTCKNIGRKFGYTKQIVSTIIDRESKTPLSHRLKVKIDNKAIKMIDLYCKKHLTPKQVAEELKVPYSTVNDIFYRYSNVIKYVFSLLKEIKEVKSKNVIDSINVDDVKGAWGNKEIEQYKKLKYIKENE